MQQSPNWRLVCLLAALAGLVLAVPSQSGAAGLVRDAASPESSDETNELMVLDDLAVTVTLTEARASITERRSYRRLDYSSGPGSVRFYRSLLPDTDASLQSLTIDGQPVDGEVLTGRRANAVRFDLAEQLRRAGSLREMGRDLYVSEPVSVQADGLIVVELTLERELAARDTLRGVSIPMDWHDHPVGTVSLEVAASTDQPLRSLYSPFHGLTVERDGARAATASYHGSRVSTTLEMAVLLSASEAPYHLDIMPFRYNERDGGFFMALLNPPAEAANAEVVPRDLVFVVDTSGSMEGEKMTQAKEALSAVLDGLRPQDSFAIVSFNGVIDAFLEDVVLAAPAQVNDGQAFVERLVAEGSTNLYGAIETGFSSLPYDRDHLRQLVLLTDGQATEGETDTETILAMATRLNEIGARVFTFGIGNDVNTVLLDRLAIESSGAAFYIRPGQSVAAAVAAFFERTAAPVLTDPFVDFSAFGATDVYPEVLPDLFAGEMVTLFGRYSQTGVATVLLEGVRAGETERVGYQVTLPELAVHNGHVPRVWATRHVGALLHQVKLGDDDPALVDEALALANRFGVITEFTYFAEDENGDVRVTYSDVPIDVVGAEAVETSASLDDYQNQGSYAGGAGGGGTVNQIGYAWDRALPNVGGWLTDTSIPDRVDWLDVHFASPTFFDLARAEASHDIGAFLSLSPCVGFEFYGQYVRVTDPEQVEPDDLPDETRRLPDIEVPDASPTTRVDVLAPDEVIDFRNPLDAAQLAEPRSAGCSIASDGPGSGLGVALGLLALVAAGRRRRR